MDSVTPSLDLTYQLPWDMYHDVIRTLVASLPLPPSGSAEDIARRDNSAMAIIASMHPANADEASLAANYVCMRAEALDCLRRSREPGIDRKVAEGLAAQSNSMMREARASHTLFLRVQAERLIRRNGGLPAKLTFGPPEDYVVRALVTGTTPTLLALDEGNETGSG